MWMEGVWELENCNFAATIVKTGSDKNYQWMLNVGLILMRSICMVLKCRPTDCKGEKKQL